MRARKTEEKAASEDKMKGVYSRLSQMENQVMEERGKADAVRSQMAAQQRINQRLQAESSAAVARMQEAHGTLLAEIEELQAENEKLRDALRTAIAEGRSRDRILLRNKQLESSTHFERYVRGMRTMHLRLLCGHARCIVAYSQPCLAAALRTRSAGRLDYWQVTRHAAFFAHHSTFFPFASVPHTADTQPPTLTRWHPQTQTRPSPPTADAPTGSRWTGSCAACSRFTTGSFK